jgi:predicted nuclease with TOPRIM domain
MTEKRFIEDGLLVRDLEKQIPTIMTHNKEQQKQFIDSLNELHEKNKELQRKNGRMQEEIEILSEENKQLKKQLRHLEYQFTAYKLGDYE